MEELISQALQEDMHIVVLALYVLGTVLKRIKAVPDCLIPVFLAGIGMVLGRRRDKREAAKRDAENR